MQVSVESGQGLERKLKVEVPAETVNIEVENRLKSMLGRVRIDGFRPGKVPMKVVRQHYGAQVFQEVAGEMIERSFRDALTQENLRPAGEPSIDTSGLVQGQALNYTATFEIYPEVTLAPVAELRIETVTAHVTDADVDNMIETLRKQRAGWTIVERAAANGDRVTISFKGTVDGDTFDGGSAENVPVVIGSGSMIPGFEEQLTGLAADAVTTIKVPFPDDYAARHLAGKQAEFEVIVMQVEVSELPAVDAEFAKTFGVKEGDVAKLREEIRANMERELENRIRAETKNRVMDKLLEINPIDVPTPMVTEEAETLRKQNAIQQPGSELPVESYTGEATRRVKLGMLLAEVVKMASIQPNQDKVRERVEKMSREYEDPDEFVRYYFSNPQLLRGVETMVMEDMVVDWLVDQAKVETVESSFHQLMNPGQ